ncbi:methyltransferase [Shewanella maritima]|uniref:methyltransferase n=1 Tax=Shewanella maritima TaxID=2520507 RepID=UPI003735D558
MTTGFSSSGIELTLHRYPKQQVSNLQAWDAADEHLIKYLKETEQACVNTAVINDSFGALTCALTSINADWPISVETDTKTSQLGIKENLALNQLCHSQITWLNSRDAYQADLGLVLMKLPKNLNYFQYQLKRLSQILPQGTKVLISAKAKLINKALLQTISSHFGPASASLTWKKTRVIECISDGIKRDTPDASTWQVPNLNLTMSNLANVFSATKLDIGARAILDHFPEGEFNHVVDLGCGNGILGLHAKQRYPQAKIYFVDDSDMAVASAKHNWQQNQSTQPLFTDEDGHFVWSDCLSQLDQHISPDLILCNPPFHQGEAITDHIAWQMFNDANKRLAAGGILHVVGNRHLGYHIKLKRIFKNCQTIASNGKFVILQAQKTN